VLSTLCFPLVASTSLKVPSKFNDPVADFLLKSLVSSRCMRALYGIAESVMMRRLFYTLNVCKANAFHLDYTVRFFIETQFNTARVASGRNNTAPAAR